MWPFRSSEAFAVWLHDSIGAEATSLASWISWTSRISGTTLVAFPSHWTRRPHGAAAAGATIRGLMAMAMAAGTRCYNHFFGCRWGGCSYSKHPWEIYIYIHIHIYIQVFSMMACFPIIWYHLQVLFEIANTPLKLMSTPLKLYETRVFPAWTPNQKRRFP